MSKMSAIQLNLPADVVVKGELEREFDPTDRDENVLEIDLPNGLTIDVGWYPELKGFQIVVFRDYWHNQDRKPIVTDDPFEVARIIRQLVAEYREIGQPAPIHR